jgi:hypothetical protein
VPGTVEERVALALAALGEVTDPADVGALVDAEQVEPGVIDLRFACTLPGYVGWRWTVSTADLPDGEPTVLEVELLPSEGALVAPSWVPWAERLAEWRRQHPDEAEAAAREAAGAAGEESDDELDAEELGDDGLDEDVLDGVEAEDGAAATAADDDSDDEVDSDDEDSDEDDDSDDEDDSDDDDSDDDDEDDDDFDEEEDDFDEDEDDDFDADGVRSTRPADEDRSL